MTTVQILVLSLSALVAVASCDKQDGGKAPRLPLNDGKSIPAMGFGTFLGFDANGQKPVNNKEVEIPVTQALGAGYRLIDSAQLYHNEDQVGAAVRSSSIPRENIFIVTKLAPNRVREPVPALQDSLQKMQLPYVDLYLIHNPVAFKPDEKAYDVVDYVDTWKAMEEAQHLGLARSIGVSNFNVTQLERLISNCKVKPAVLQIEANLNLIQPRLMEFCKQHGIVVMGFTPFGSLFDKEADARATRADDPGLKSIAEKHGKTVAQIALRYLVQEGVVPIPKSVNKKRIEENIDIFDFELTPEEMESLRKFNNGFRTINMSFWQDHPYFPFEKLDKPLPNPFHQEKQ